MRCRKRGVVAVECAILAIPLLTLALGAFHVADMLYTRQVLAGAAAVASVSIMAGNTDEEAQEAATGIAAIVGGTVTLSGGVVTCEAQTTLWHTDTVTYSQPCPSPPDTP
jgi:Flp pilus assembly protein TadG